MENLKNDSIAYEDYLERHQKLSANWYENNKDHVSILRFEKYREDLEKIGKVPEKDVEQTAMEFYNDPNNYGKRLEQ